MKCTFLTVKIGYELQSRKLTDWKIEQKAQRGLSNMPQKGEACSSLRSFTAN